MHVLSILFILKIMSLVGLLYHLSLHHLIHNPCDFSIFTQHTSCFLLIMFLSTIIIIIIIIIIRVSECPFQPHRVYLFISEKLIQLDQQLQCCLWCHIQYLNTYINIYIYKYKYKYKYIYINIYINI